MPQDGPKMAQDGPEMALRCPKIPPFLLGNIIPVAIGISPLSFNSQNRFIWTPEMRRQGVLKSLFCVAKIGFREHDAFILAKPLNGPKRRPLLFLKMVPRWPKMAQDGPKMAPRWPKMATKWPQDAPRWPKMAPRWPQDGPTWSQMVPKWSPNGPQSGPKLLQS